MANTIWKGSIEIGGLSVPVRFYSAVNDRTIRFHLLHAPDETRVKQVMVNASTGDSIPADRVRRGFAVAPDTLVMVDRAELDSLVPKDSRTVRVEHFVPRVPTNHQWYERPYILGPDSNSSDYFALAEALAESRLEGVARWVMRKRRYLGSLQASHGYLVMITLRTANEVVPVASLPKPAGRALQKKELALAEQLVAGLRGRFDPARYRDEHRERVMSLIKAKASGHKPKLRLVRPSAVTAPDELLRTLAASVRSLRKGA